MIKRQIRTNFWPVPNVMKMTMYQHERRQA